MILNGRTFALAVALTALIAFADWRIGFDVSLSPLYTVPMILAGLSLRPPPIIGMACACAVLQMLFDSASSTLALALRCFLAVAAYISVGLFVAAQEKVRHEQQLRAQAEEQLKAMVESSPAAILTLGERGNILAANNSANAMFGLQPEESLVGSSIDGHLPVLRDALILDTSGEPFRTAAQSQGRRRNGEIFLADIWFSTYAGPEGKRLAAIVVDSSEEMKEREERSLRQLSTGSRILASAILHEVRNLCGAFSVVYSNLIQKGDTCRIEDLKGLGNVVEGLARVTTLELQRKDQVMESISVQRLLDDLRIVIEPNWTEIDGQIRWEMPEQFQRVVADRHALLQVFLNISQNSHRAVQEVDNRELRISLTQDERKTQIRFHDSGPGVRDPRALFQPFQQGAASAGLGLYISRALMRNFGGELKHEPVGNGACFVVEVPSLPAREAA